MLPILLPRTNKNHPSEVLQAPKTRKEKERNIAEKPPQYKRPLPVSLWSSCRIFKNGKALKEQKCLSQVQSVELVESKKVSAVKRLCLFECSHPEQLLRAMLVWRMVGQGQGHATSADSTPSEPQLQAPLEPRRLALHARCRSTWTRLSDDTWHVG